MGMSLTISAVPRQRSHSQVRLLRDSMITFCCLIFETPPTWRDRYPYLYPSGTRWPSYTPRYWVPFSSPPTTRRDTVEVIDSALIRVWTSSPSRSRLYLRTDHIENTVPLLLYQCCVGVCCCGNVFTEPLPRNGSGMFPYLEVVAW
jgi:hypothetical protein